MFITWGLVPKSRMLTHKCIHFLFPQIALLKSMLNRCFSGACILLYEVYQINTEKVSVMRIQGHFLVECII